MSFAITSTFSANEARSTPHGQSAVPKFLLVMAVVVIVVIAAVRAGICWRNDTGISFASGVMITMASDLKEGVFYRPLYDSQGYGGTRYFPLHFCLHALLLKLGLPVLASAYLLSTAAMGLLMFGTFRLLRELGADPWLAGCAAAMVLASRSVQWSLAVPQADGLAAALNVCGLAVIVRPPRSRSKVLLASLLFILAWSAKLTTVFGLLAALIWLMATGYLRIAWQLAAETCCGYLMVAAAMILGSHGRVVDIFKACASGGSDWRFIASTPLRIKAIVVHSDPGLVWFAVLAVLCVFLVRFSKFLQSLPALFLTVTMAVTVLIFTSPGTAANHLLDVQVTSVILLVACVANARSQQQKQLGICALAGLTAIGVVYVLRNLKPDGRIYHPHQFRRVVEVIGPSTRPILSENPVIPVLAGQHPYVLDPWMVQLLRSRISGFGEPLLERLRGRSFSAVVLSTGDPEQKGPQWWYDNVNFGPGFVPVLLENYRLVQVIDNDRIYVPKEEKPSTLGAAP